MTYTPASATPINNNFNFFYFCTFGISIQNWNVVLAIWIQQFLYFVPTSLSCRFFKTPKIGVGAFYTFLKVLNENGLQTESEKWVWKQYWIDRSAIFFVVKVEDKGKKWKKCNEDKNNNV